MRRTLSCLAHGFRLLCALALMMVGFAHRPVLAETVSLRYAAYVLPDGKLPTLCINDIATPAGKSALHDYGCDACRLATSILLPEPPSIASQAMSFANIARVVIRQFRLTRALYPPSSGPRASPSSLIDI